MVSNRLAASFHAFTSILLAGTLWRVASYHLVASSNPTFAHIGGAMATQY